WPRWPRSFSPIAAPPYPAAKCCTAPRCRSSGRLRAAPPGAGQGWRATAAAARCGSGGDAPEGPKGLLAAHPQEPPFFLGRGGAELPRPVGPADGGTRFRLLVEARLEAVHLDDQHRGGIQRKTEPEGLLDRLDNEVVHHLQSRGYNALLDDAGNGAGCVVD